MSDEATIREALGYIPPDDRDEWVRVGMAVKDAMGEAGWPVWSQWSAQWPDYKEKDARAVWRSFKGTQKAVTVRTLYWMAKQRGWSPRGGALQAPVRTRDPEAARKVAEERRRRRQRQEAARKEAGAMIRRAKRERHPYMDAKGFPESVTGLVLDGLLLVPVMDERRGVQSLQTIGPDGEKKFLPGGRMTDGRHVIGSYPWPKDRVWFCEGYATGWSIHVVLRAMHVGDPVMVCFSDGQLRRIAGGWRAKGRTGVVIADNDASMAGLKAAVASRLPYWMPPEVGTDFNDYHLNRGLEAAIQALREALA